MHAGMSYARLEAEGGLQWPLSVALTADLADADLVAAVDFLRVELMLPPAVGGYPVNYGFVPQTVSYDGDPFDDHSHGSHVSGTIGGSGDNGAGARPETYTRAPCRTASHTP